MKNFQRILSSMHRAIQDYKMIEPNDKIAVGVSGGKDSLCLLKALAIYKNFCKTPFDLVAILVDQSDGKFLYEEIQKFCIELNVKFYIVRTQIFDVVFNIRKEKNPCSLCAKMRRGSLNEKAVELGCNKVALAHHFDDLLETFFMSAIHEGRLNTFWPKTYLSNTNIFVLRPFCYVDENQIIVEKNTLPIFTNPCPANKLTERENIKNIIKLGENNFKDFKTNLKRALLNTEKYNLLDKCKNKNN